MPRAFLIKKKRHYGLSSSSVNIKKRSSSPDTTAAELSKEFCESKEKSYESGSESGCSSASGRMPSPASSTNGSAEVPVMAARSPIVEVYGRPSVLEPLNLNASAAAAAAAAPWMKPFLTPYLPFNFPYPSPYSHSSYHSEAPYPAHFLPASSPSSHRVVHSHQALSVPRGSLYPSRSEPPSPSCPCPLSPYTPPRDGTPPEKEQSKLVEQAVNGKRALQFSATPAAKTPTSYLDGTYTVRNAIPAQVDSRYSPTFWTDNERCSSTGSIQSDSKDSEDQMIIITREDSPKNLVINSGSRRRSQDGGPRYQCPDCNKSYSTFSGLSKHQQFHCSTTNKKSFSCKYCEKVYMSLGALKMHIRTHTLPCKCKLCGKAFSRPWLLQGHIRTHTGEKPFACPHCNRAFADRSNLRAHLQTHSDVKKYSCKTCAKTFSRMSLLLKHVDGGCTANVANVATTLTQERLGP